MAKYNFWERLTYGFRNKLPGKPDSPEIVEEHGIFENGNKGQFKNYKEGIDENNKDFPVPGYNTPVALPNKRSSVPHQPLGGQFLTGLGAQYRVVNQGFVSAVIPIIRALMKVNPDVGQAINNIVALGNTGHKISFDRKVPVDQVNAMREHLNNKKILWADGQAGMDGLVNKMFAQVLVGGALSNEWVPNINLDGIESVILVNPEDIQFVLENDKTKYSPYQRPTSGLTNYGVVEGATTGLIKLNQYTYKYYALNGDTEVPYGFPPYMSVLERVNTQNKMLKNVDAVVDQMGLLGFLTALIGKPDQNPGETQTQYTTRLNQLLIDCKTIVTSGMNDGVVVGFKDDAEFEFTTLGKAVTQAMELYQNNELMVASALKQDATLWGRNYGTTESQITVVFMKMLAELKNIQNIIKCNLEFGYALELVLAGFKFDYLKVSFNRSTLQDDLKYQQAEEIKVRNVTQKMILGLIDQDQAADELGYELPSSPQPMVPWVILAGGTMPLDKSATATKREKGKDTSDKKVRSKNKPISKDK